MTPTVRPRKRKMGPIQSASRWARYSFTVTTWTPLPASALRYAGSVATSVLPSPVFISAILPRWRTMPPISCTSKCRMFSVRRPASRTTAKASGSTSSSDSPSATRWRNSAVLARSCSSVSALVWASSELICATIGAIRLSSRSLAVPKTFARALSMIIADGYPVIVTGVGHRKEGLGIGPRKRAWGRGRGPGAEGLGPRAALFREQRHRVGQAAVHPDLVVQMAAGGPPRRSDVTDDVAALDLLAVGDREARQVAVLRDDAEAMVEHHHVAVGAVGPGGADGRVAGGHDRLAVIGGDVEPGMKVLVVGEGILARPVVGRQPPRHWPDRRRRRG